MGLQGLRGSRVRPTGSLRGQGLGQQGPRGSRDGSKGSPGWPTGSQRVNGGCDGAPVGQGRHPRGPRESIGKLEVSSDDIWGSKSYADFWYGWAGGRHQR